MYRYTRHVYDLSRKYYLFGRDRLLRKMQIAEGDRVIEVGCGTARNLVKLRRHLERNGVAAELFGLDASAEMLKTAQQSLDRRGLSGIELRVGLAEKLDYRDFGIDRPFDVIFFSYSLSMIPPWPEALMRAVEQVAPGGRIYVVDFWDQGGLPKFFGGTLRKWLDLFDVHYRPELPEKLNELKEQGLAAEVNIDSIGGRYALLAEVIRQG